VPVGWGIRRNGRIFAERNESGFPDLPILEVSLKTGVRVRDFDLGLRKQVITDRAMYKRAAQRDLAYNMMRMWQGAVGVVPVDGLVSPAYVVARPLPGMVPDYFVHLYRTSAYMGEVDNYSRGIVKDRNRLYWDQFKQIPTPCPPFADQVAIVRFIDHADRRIRQYIRAKQKLIQLLVEQKQSIIHRAVTRGLDPNVSLKPSGVEWLGEVPQHWEVRTLGHIADSFRTGPFGSILHQSEYVDGGTPIVNPTHMHGGSIVADSRCSVPPPVAARLSNYVLKEGDVVFSRRGELGRCALVRVPEAGWICGTGSLRVRTQYVDLEPEYMIQVLQMRWVGEYLSLFSVGATMDSLNTGILKRVPVLLPPVAEQRKILEVTAGMSAVLSDAVDSARREIELLREYRTRLMADVVTGKLDVRETSARLPERGDELEPLDEIESEGDTVDAGTDDVDEVLEAVEA
jgi:type I restriction enzyme S subunit